MSRPLENLLELGKENFYFLKNSMNLFYQGNYFEVKRISSTIRTLVHETNQSKSLIKQIENHPDNKYKEPMGFYDSGSLPESLLIPGTIYSGCTTPLIPLYCEKKEFIQFFPHRRNIQDWWEGVKLGSPNTQKTFWNRKDLVLKYANKEGGSHVDPIIPTDFMQAQQSFQYVGEDYEFGIGYVIVYEAGLTMLQSFFEYLMNVEKTMQTRT